MHCTDPMMILHVERGFYEAFPAGNCVSEVDLEASYGLVFKLFDAIFVGEPRERRQLVECDSAMGSIRSMAIVRQVLVADRGIYLHKSLLGYEGAEEMLQVFWRV